MTDKPPTARTDYAAGMQQHCGKGLVLQSCDACNTVQYPPRELCRCCLGTSLSWQPLDGKGYLLACVELHHSFEPWFASRLPWLLVSVRLEQGVTLLCHGHTAISNMAMGSEVQVQLLEDQSGSTVLLALPASVQKNFASLEAAFKEKDRQD